MQIINIAKTKDYYHGQAKSTRGRRWRFGITPSLKTVWVDRELNYAGRVYWLHFRTAPAALRTCVRQHIRDQQRAA